MEAQPGLDEEARAALRRAMLDETYRAARAEYASTLLAVLVNIEDWLAVDSWLGGGKVSDTSRREEFGADLIAFRGVATVVCMAAELAEAAVVMAGKNRYYAVGAVIRQLIECEYLLTLFNEDLDHARRWLESTPDEVRESFTPAKMRKLTGSFSNEEYWGHCSTGGHPAPKGARLLEKLDPRRQSWPYSAAELATDLGLHLRRIWSAIDAQTRRARVRCAPCSAGWPVAGRPAIWACWTRDRSRWSSGAGLPAGCGGCRGRPRSAGLQLRPVAVAGSSPRPADPGAGRLPVPRLRPRRGCRRGRVHGPGRRVLTVAEPPGGPPFRLRIEMAFRLTGCGTRIATIRRSDRRGRGS